MLLEPGGAVLLSGTIITGQRERSRAPPMPALPAREFHGAANGFAWTAVDTIKGLAWCTHHTRSLILVWSLLRCVFVCTLLSAENVKNAGGQLAITTTPQCQLLLAEINKIR